MPTSSQCTWNLSVRFIFQFSFSCSEPGAYALWPLCGVNQSAMSSDSLTKHPPHLDWNAAVNTPWEIHNTSLRNWDFSNAFFPPKNSFFSFTTQRGWCRTIGCCPPFLSVKISTTFFNKEEHRHHHRQLTNMPLLSTPNVLVWFFFSCRIS